MAIDWTKLLPLVCLVPMLAATAPTPPTAIAAYIHDGRFEPGDYQWFHGAFDGASPAETAAYKAMIDWRRECRTSDMAETRADLAKLDVAAGKSLDTIPYRTLICDQIATEPEPVDLHDWAGFARDVAVVRPIALGFLASVSMGEDSADIASADLRDALDARVVGEQTLRRGISWAIDGAPTPGSLALTLTQRQRGILVSQFAMALASRDHANTAWLKGVVAARGWPKRSQIGDHAAKMAWLLVQHADADPAFQVRALRLMEPLVATGEVDRKNYAYLYDRVMLKLAGKQRYATQLTCKNRQFVPLPLEDEGLVDSRRREAGLGTLAEYEAQFLTDMGPCQDVAAE